MKKQNKILLGILGILVVVAVVLVSSGAGLLKGMLVVKKTSIVISPVCGEDYHSVSKTGTDMDQTELNYFNGKYTNWYVCDLNDSVRNGVGMTCPATWNAPSVNPLYNYDCSVTHSTPAPPNAPTSPDQGCSVNYLHGAISTQRLYRSTDYYSSMRCSKQGTRPANSPCATNYMVEVLGHRHVICGK